MRGASALSVISYEPNGSKNEIKSFFDKAEGAASRIAVLTGAAIELARSNKNFRKMLMQLRNKSKSSHKSSRESTAKEIIQVFELAKKVPSSKTMKASRNLSQVYSKINNKMIKEIVHEGKKFTYPVHAISSNYHIVDEVKDSKVTLRLEPNAIIQDRNSMSSLTGLTDNQKKVQAPFGRHESRHLLPRSSRRDHKGQNSFSEAKVLTERTAYR